MGLELLQANELRGALECLELAVERASMYERTQLIARCMYDP